ncbi:MAG: hypothetical protein JXA46_19725 [Dehalococcoidales bacterium]|nr:hypothetical protein [Dehalococcoidales bacterium]
MGWNKTKSVKIFKVLLIIAVVSVLLVAAVPVDSAESQDSAESEDSVVEFSDPGLENAVREILGNPSDPLYQSDLLSITNLNASGAGISDLSGIQYCTNLVHLNLGDNRIRDLSGLVGLTSLSELNLDINRVNDLSLLVNNSGLGNDDRLYLEYNYLDLTAGSENMVDIATLEGRGMDVDYSPQKEAGLNINILLQGGNRPYSGWLAPVIVKFFTPGTEDVLTEPPLDTRDLTAFKESDRAVVMVEDVTPGKYDITVSSPHCLTNLRREVEVNGIFSNVNMCTLREGDANDDDEINIQDFGILAAAYGKNAGDDGYDARADFDRSGRINIADFGLLAVNYGRAAPVVIVVRTLTMYNDSLPQPPINGMTLQYVAPSYKNPGTAELRIKYSYFMWGVYIGVTDGKLWASHVPEREAVPQSWLVFYDSMGLNDCATYDEDKMTYWFYDLPPWLDIEQYDPELTELPVFESITSTNGSVTVVYCFN